MNVNEKQVGGTHYGLTQFQHWDYAAIWYVNRYFESAASKYVLRHRNKNGVQDLAKAEHYLEKLLELHTHGYVKSLGRVHSENMVLNGGNGVTPGAYVDTAREDLKKVTENSTEAEREVLWGLTFWGSTEALRHIITKIREMINNYGDRNETTAG